MKKNKFNRRFQEQSEYPYQKVLYTRKVTKTVKGGKNISFYVIAIAGNKKNSIGVGVGKSRTISDAIDKSLQNAVKNVIKVDKVTSIRYKYCASQILILKKSNTIIRANNYISEIFEALGVHNISCRVLGSKNIINNIFCVFNAFKAMQRMFYIKKERGEFRNKNKLENHGEIN